MSDHGVQLFRDVLTRDNLNVLEDILSCLPRDHAGFRLRGIEGLAPFLASNGQIGRYAASILGDDCKPVRAILFDKTPQTNWSLGWHQDRTIAVKERAAVDGFENWSVKDGMLHVEPPFELLSRMVTLRVHFDPVPAGNAPLLIAPGSHKLGRVAGADIREIIRQSGTVACLAGRGDIWLYATPILHAPEAAVAPARRRVLQVDFSGDSLPRGLEWLGV